MDVYQRLVNANYNLNVHRRALMYDFSHFALDPVGKRPCRNSSPISPSCRHKWTSKPRAVWRLYPSALNVNINA